MSKAKHPKGGKLNKGHKSKQSTPIQSFNENAKQAALRHSLSASTRRLQSATSDTETNRSFLIFNTPVPQPSSIQIYNVDAEPTNDNAYEIIAINDPTDFMETSSISPRTNRPQLIASSSLENNNSNNAKKPIQFNKSTKKIDKIVDKINILNAENANINTPVQQNTSIITEPQVIYLDSSNSPHNESVIELIQTEEDQQTTNTEKQIEMGQTANKDNCTFQMERDIPYPEQAPTKDDNSFQMEPDIPPPKQAPNKGNTQSIWNQLSLQKIEAHKRRKKPQM